MKKQFSGRVKLIMLLALVLAVVTAIVSALFGATWAQKAVQTVITPIRSGVSSITRQAERYYNYLFGYESLEADNAYLQGRVAALEDEARKADALERENERLRELMHLMDEHVDYKLLDAYIISWESSNWKNAFSIGKGTNDGLQEGMVVITEYHQVIGIIKEVGPNWANVTTVLDSSLEISASVASSGYTGVVQGSYTDETHGKLRMKYLPSEAVLRNNDQVITTGSTVYPKDLVLGYVEDAGYDETGVAKYALLTPAADFDNLEQVFIVTDYSKD